MDVNAFYHELLEQDLGLHVMGLDYRFKEFVEVVESKSLPTFSTYVPALYRTVLDMRDQSKLIRKDFAEEAAEFYIDDPILDKFHLDILEVGEVTPIGTNNHDPYDPSSADWYSSILASRNNFTLESVLFNSEATYFRTLTDTALPWRRQKDLVGPRVIRFKNWALMAPVSVELYVRWPTLSSLPFEYKESFKSLASLDLKMYIWNSLKYIEDVVTPTGNLNLRIADFEAAARERDDFIRDLKNRSLPDRVFDSYYSIL